MLSGPRRSAPAGERILTTSRDRTARLWDGKTGAVLAILDGHVFSADGARIVTASDDHTARLWHGRTGALLGTLEGHTGPIYSAAFSPDGRRVVTGSHDRTARVWSVCPLPRDDTASWIAIAGFRVLTPEERSAPFS